MFKIDFLLDRCFILLQLNLFSVGDNVSDDLSSSEILKEPFFSAKLLRLFGILSTFRLINLCCLMHVFI